MAPNLVTFIGFLFMISSYVCILFYDLTLSADIPNWLFIKAGFDFLIYQTLDALDGKQARRTNSSSPLGQLFDHGCDSFSLTFFIMVMGQALKVNKNIVYATFLGSEILMFQSNWVEYYTHVLNTQYGNFGVTETELIAATICFLAGINGQSFFQITLAEMLPEILSKQIPFEILLNTNVGELVAYFVNFLFILIGLTAFFFTFVKSIKTNKERIESILMHIPILIISIIDYYWYNSVIYEEYAGFILFSLGLIHSFITSCLIICSLTRMKFPKLQVPLVIFTILSLVDYFLLSDWSIQDKFYVFFVVSLLNIGYTIFFFRGVINQITTHLGIYCFSLKKRAKKID
ncbi:hypothetical protein PPERSA_07565 [Pseudocohnilembus persalinus]|uniref:CDP-alcohol phosphatidyltransferase n=1 Tax=Pseudocohnilembus persalinus TaxID=266149 RepID=A0A0V0QZT1_PSEPJ|nr:hypothetical protein PPERSA_07565 [Pseudocohnilembus persalinus]|eukprot:KRX07815.1 hypothetical protein PPERSA_07565 [Pseudocohnilembus persalinus]